MLALVVCFGLSSLPALRGWAQDKAVTPTASVESDTISEKDLTIEKGLELHQRVALRSWYAQWKEKNYDDMADIDHGSAFFNQLYYTLFLDKWYIVAMGGEGGYLIKNKWDTDVFQGTKRYDVQVGFGRAIGPLLLGLSARYSKKSRTLVGGHYIIPEVLQRDTIEQTYAYYGPEAFAGIGIPIGKSGFSVAASATITYMLVNVNNDYIEYNGPGTLDNPGLKDREQLGDGPVTHRSGTPSISFRYQPATVCKSLIASAKWPIISDRALTTTGHLKLAKTQCRAPTWKWRQYGSCWIGYRL
jgi:hypothetical protein